MCIKSDFFFFWVVGILNAEVRYRLFVAGSEATVRGRGALVLVIWWWLGVGVWVGIGG